MNLSHRIRLYPNNKQATYFRRACGVRRLAYNWALAESKRLHEQGTKTSGYDLCKRFNAIKDERYPFVRDVSKWVPQKAIYDAWDSLKRWWSKTSKAPRFKKKGRCKESFYIGLDKFKCDGKKICIPKLGWVKMAQEVRFPGKQMSVTISQDGDRWFAAVQVEIDESQWSYPHTCETQAVCGVDLGVHDLAVLDDGTKIKAPRGLRRRERKLRKLQKSVSRKVKGSSSRKKAIKALASCHRKIRDTRKDVPHKITSKLVREYRAIGIEDLNVKGMVKNHRLARSVSDASFGEIRRQLEYKAVLAGSEVVVVDRFFPSSKTCSGCGHIVGSLPLRVREWECSACGVVHDRDVNAAINLRKVARRHRETQNAGGEGIRPDDLGYQAASMKPESSVCPSIKKVV